MHDGPIGWFRNLLLLILHYFRTQHQPSTEKLDIDILNDRINTFDYKSNSLKNKPPNITRTEVLRRNVSMTGSEMQTFISIFSMLTGDLLPRNSKAWRLYMLMRQIMDIVMSRNLLKGSTNQLRTLVSEHLKLFLKVFPDERVKPKGHNFTHYATVIEESGSIPNLSTIRFEGFYKTKER